MSAFKTKMHLTKEAGQFKFEFFYTEGKLEKTYLSITTTSGIFSMRIAGNTDAYGYLFAAAQKNLIDQLHGYAITLCIPAMTIMQDEGLCDDIQRAVLKWQRRKDKASEQTAKGVTETEEAASQALMEDVAAYAEATPKERKKLREADRAAMREALIDSNTRN